MLKRTDQIAALAALSIVVGCSRLPGASGSKDHIAGDIAESGQDSGDDDTVAVPVPMALVSPDFLASLDAGLDSGASSGGGEVSMPTGRVDEAIAVGLEAATTQTTAITGRLQQHLRRLHLLQASLFGPTGYFGGKTILVRPDRPALFAMDAEVPSPWTTARARFAKVQVLAADAPYRFQVDVYCGASAATSVQTCARFAFKPLERDAAHAAVSLQFFDRHETRDETWIIHASYESDTLKIDGQFGDHPPREGDPDRIVFHVDAATDPGRLAVETIEVYDGAGGFFSGLFGFPRNGDLLLVRSLLAREKAVAVYEAAVVPAADVAGFLAKPDARLFRDNGVDRFLAAFRTRILRDPVANPGCAAYGTAMRDAHEGTQPPALASMPASVCAANKSLTDAAFDAAVRALCKTSADVVQTLAIESLAAFIPDMRFSLCEFQRHSVEGHANPWHVVIQDGQRRLLGIDETPGAASTALAADLAASPLSLDARYKASPVPEASREDVESFAGARNTP